MPLLQPLELVSSQLRVPDFRIYCFVSVIFLHLVDTSLQRIQKVDFVRTVVRERKVKFRIFLTFERSPL